MAKRFLLVPGAGGVGFYWHRVEPLLRAAGFETFAVDLPNWEGATLVDQTQAITSAGRGADDVVLVAQSMGAFSAVPAADRLPVSALFLLNAMIPAPGETANDWWGHTAQNEAQRAHDVAEGRDPDAEFDPMVVFLHDVPDEVIARLGEEDTSPAQSLFAVPAAFTRWPEVATTVLSGRDDRLFPYDFQQRVARERLGLDVEPLPGGHLLALSQPEALAARLLA